jgi:hypothetical protein
LWRSVQFRVRRPDHNERAHDYKISIAETAFAEGYPTVHLTLLD